MGSVRKLHRQYPPPPPQTPRRQLRRLHLKLGSALFLSGGALRGDGSIYTRTKTGCMYFVDYGEEERDPCYLATGGVWRYVEHIVDDWGGGGGGLWSL